MEKNKKDLAIFMIILFALGAVGIFAVGPRGKGLESAKRAVEVQNETTP